MVSSAMTRARSAPVDQDFVDMTGVGDQPFHLGGGSARSFATQSSTSAFLKLENCPPPNSVKTSALLRSESAA